MTQTLHENECQMNAGAGRRSLWSAQFKVFSADGSFANIHQSGSSRVSPIPKALVTETHNGCSKNGGAP
jgi:hypothetical protein